MHELFLPWWSVLLLGMWAAALTLWMHPTVNRELRFWSGLSTLVYLVLIFIALGGGPRAGVASAPSSATFGVIDLLLTACIAISLTAGVWSLGRISLQSRQSSYVILTLANASLCAVLNQPEISFGLLIIAGLTARPLIRRWSRHQSLTLRERLANFTQFTEVSAPRGLRGEFCLISVFTGVLAITLLGTISYSLHVETNRATSSPQRSALPSTEQFDRVLPKQTNSLRESSLVDLALGTRADLVVLMAIIVFLCLAMSITDPVRSSSERSTTTNSVTPSSRETP